MELWLKDVKVVLVRSEAGGMTPLPAGYAYLTDSNGAYLMTSNGEYIAVMEE